MSDASPEHHELPSYGQNGRDLILKAARELESKVSRKARERSPVAQPQPDFDDESYYAAVPAERRPTIAYDPRAKIPRVIRQTALTRFVAQRLRLAARAVPNTQKLSFVAQQHILSAAIQDATAQEAALLQRAGNKQVLYSNLLARTKAHEVAAPAEPSQRPPEQPAANISTREAEEHAGSDTASGSAKAELKGAGQFSCCGVQPPQHAVEANEGDASDAAAAPTPQSATASTVHAGVKRKHAEAEPSWCNGAVQVVDSC